ncbi:MAG: DUF2911 domain-containing protein [Acidobacteriota bacterium]
MLRSIALRVAVPVTALALVLTICPPVDARPDAPPRLSPQGSVTQAVGVAEIDIVYGRPSARERTIWGELVPYGEVWRTGANEATTFEVSHDVTIQGQPLAAGKYALFTIPGEETWTLIFNSEPDQWGAYRRDPELDVLTVETKAQPAPFLERFEISVPVVTDHSAQVHLHWTEVQVPFTVLFDLEADVVSSVSALAASGEGGSGLWNWLDYMYENEIALDKAAGWASELAAKEPMYWTLALDARLQAATGDHAAAVQAGEKALGRVAAEKEQRGVTQDAQKLGEQLEGWRAGGAGDAQR